MNYFTSNKESAKGYTELGIEREGNIYACYLNITNPYIVDNETEKEFRSWKNIRDRKIREKQIKYFNRIYSYWQYYEDWDNSDVIRLNDNFAPLGFFFKEEDDGYYSLWEMEKNTMWGAEHEVIPDYTLTEFFEDDDLYDEMYEHIIGDKENEDDYFFNTDEIVKYVLLMNREDKTNYDGIVISDIIDVGPTGSPFTSFGTDVITLKSSNQIKSIYNKTPTDSSNISEDLIFEDKYVDIIADYDVINKYLHYNYEWADTPDEENYSQLIDKEGRFIHCPPSKSSFTHKLLLDDLIESGLVSMGDAYNYLNTSLFGNLGYVRCNDYDAYVQLPQNITYDQIDAISKWIDEYFLGRGYTVIDTSCEENKTYSRYMFEYDDRHQADDYIKMLKRFKNSGKLIESLKHINEDLMRKEGMYVFHSPYSLVDFLKNQTKDIRILYDANLDLYFACDGDKYIHYDLIKQAEKEGYYYKLNDFIDELGALQNYVDYGVNGGYVGEDGEDFEYIDPYLYYIIFSPNNEFELGDDDYDEEYNTSIGRFLTRDCDLEEIDLYDVVKRYM